MCRGCWSASPKLCFLTAQLLVLEGGRLHCYCYDPDLTVTTKLILQHQISLGNKMSVLVAVRSISYSAVVCICKNNPLFLLSKLEHSAALNALSLEHGGLRERGVIVWIAGGLGEAESNPPPSHLPAVWLDPPLGVRRQRRLSLWLFPIG